MTSFSGQQANRQAAEEGQEEVQVDAPAADRRPRGIGKVHAHHAGDRSPFARPDPPTRVPYTNDVYMLVELAQKLTW